MDSNDLVRDNVHSHLIMQNGQWLFQGGGCLSNGRFPWEKEWDSCSEVNQCQSPVVLPDVLNQAVFTCG